MGTVVDAVIHQKTTTGSSVGERNTFRKHTLYFITSQTHFHAGNYSVSTTCTQSLISLLFVCALDLIWRKQDIKWQQFYFCHSWHQFVVVTRSAAERWVTQRPRNVCFVVFCTHIYVCVSEYMYVNMYIYIYIHNVFNPPSGPEGPTGWCHQRDGSKERLRPQSSGESVRRWWCYLIIYNKLWFQSLQRSRVSPRAMKCWRDLTVIM